MDTLTAESLTTERVKTLMSHFAWRMALYGQRRNSKNEGEASAAARAFFTEITGADLDRVDLDKIVG